VVHGQGGCRGRSSAWRSWQFAGARSLLTAVVVNPRKARRMLRRMERDLAYSDPRLNMLFESFAVQAQGAKIPGKEMTRTRRLRLAGWLARRVSTASPFDPASSES
jgi:hypothetical protein